MKVLAAGEKRLLRASERKYENNVGLVSMFSDLCHCIYLYDVGTTNFVPTLMRCLQAPKSGVLASGGTSSRAQLSL